MRAGAGRLRPRTPSQFPPASAAPFDPPARPAVAAGRLGPGDQLPTIRALHERLEVNPNTVAKAYRELQHLGVIAAEHGSGCFIAPGAEARSAELPARAAALLTRRTAIFSVLCFHFWQMCIPPSNETQI